MFRTALNGKPSASIALNRRRLMLNRRRLASDRLQLLVGCRFVAVGGYSGPAAFCCWVLLCSALGS